MIARKVPSGAKHAPCFDHVPHPYTSTGWLCVGTREPDRAADMVAFADHLAAVMVERRAARVAELAIPATGRVEGTSEHTCTDGKTRYNATVGGSGCDFASVHAHGFAGTGRVIQSAEERDAIARLSAELNARKGRPEVVAPVIPATEPVKVARKARTVKRPSPMAAAIDALAARTAERGVPLVQPEPEPVPVAPEPVAIIEPSQCWTYLHTLGGTRRCVRRPDHHDGAHEYSSVLVPVMSPIVAPAPAPEPIVAPEPVLAAVAPVQTAERPTCERCGQTFRKSGNGAEWHRLNRPDCASVARVAA